MKVKKWLLGLVTFAAMVVICAVCASAETYGDFEYSVRDDGTVEITDYNGSAKTVDIPAEIDGKSVTNIGRRAFELCRNLTSITIPDSVTSIGPYAFSCCANLVDLTIGDDVKYLSTGAFSGCSSLTDITIPDGVAIDWDVFKGCVSLKNVNVKSGNNSYTSVCGYTSVNGVLFSKDKTKLVLYPAGKTDKIYNIPESVTNIGRYAFDHCVSLTNVTIPNNMDSIYEYAFNDCVNLTNIIIPDSVIIMGYGAFNGCTSLTEIKVASKNANYVSVNGVLYNKNKTTLMHYPAGKKDKNYSILDGVTEIDGCAFKGCTSLYAVTIPNGVTCINIETFTNCTSLTSITIPSSVTSIGGNAFEGCASLTSITIPNSVTSIGDSAFYGCSSLTSITIPNGVMEIGELTFRNCANLTSITISDGVTSIGYSAFEYCTSLKSITIPESVTSIGDCAFADCTSLTSITIPGSVTSIGDYALGFYIDYNTYNYAKYDNFKIYCYSGTAGEQYAKENGFDYELITAEKPANVTGFKVKSIFSTNVTLQWNKNSSASGYEIEQYKGGKWTNVAKIKGNATTSYTVKGLAAGTAGYQFRIRAYRTEGKNKAYSGYSATVKVNPNPYGVGGFKCSSKTSTSVTLKWNKGTTASGYQLQQYKDGKWVTIYTGTKATNTSYTVKKLKAGTAGYRFRIRAYKTYGNTKQYGSWSSEVKVNTNPYGVGGFKCSSKTSTSVTLKWNKGTTASGYQLQQYKDGKWVTIYTGTKATNTSFTVKKLKAGTAGYRFRIRAYKTYGNTKQYGSWSSEVKVNTNPYGVGGFKCSSKTSTSVTLKWNKGTTASGYQLQQYKDGKWVTIYTGTKATNTSYTVKNLKAGTAGYRFRIRAYKTYGNTKQYGSWSSEVKVNTNPYGVGGFKAKSTAKNSITLGWNKGTTASGYQLQQYKGGKWVTVYTGTKATSTSCTIKSLKANTSYKFRIRAYKTYGNAKQYGSWSKVLTVKTKK